jgi:hypothetical protein
MEVAYVNWVIWVSVPLFVSSVGIFLVGLECLEVIRAFNHGDEHHLKHVGNVQSNRASRIVLPVNNGFFPEESWHVDHDRCPFVPRDLSDGFVGKTVSFLDPNAAPVVLEM